MVRKSLFTAYTAILGAVSFVTPAKADFTGIYGGASITANLWRDTLSGGSFIPVQVNKYSFKEYGVYGGYMMEAGDTKVIGGAELYKIKVKSKPVVKPLALAATPAATNVTFTHNDRMGVGIIAGKMISPKVMIYAKLARETVSYTIAMNGVTVYSSKIKGNVPGMGGNYLVSKNLMVGGEYSYVALFKKQIFNALGTAFTYKPVEHRLTIRATLKM